MPFEMIFPGVDPAGDENHNGISNLIEHAVGGELPPVMVFNVYSATYVSYVRPIGSGVLSASLMQSPDLGDAWAEFGASLEAGVDYVVESRLALDGGRASATFRFACWTIGAASSAWKCSR